MDEIEQAIYEMGPNFNPEVLLATSNLYRVKIDNNPAGVEQLDVPYGPNERHRLDIYYPNEISRGIVIFVHGGGFVAGDKRSDGAYYANVGRWLARQGYTAVLPNYRLAPTYKWPSGAQDVGSVLSWVSENLHLNSTPNSKILLWGQSAGATHVSTWFWHPNLNGGVEAEGLHAIFLMSGLYKVSKPIPPGPADYFGEDEKSLLDQSPISHIRKTPTKIWLSLTELDPAWLATQTYDLARELSVKNGCSPAFHYFHGHNHVSTVCSLGSNEHSIERVMIDALNMALK